MKDIQKIAENLIGNFLKIHRDDIVSIASEIYNTNNTTDPLVEMKMVEALFLELSLKKAYPILNISVQSIQERLKQEIPEFRQFIPQKINHVFLENIDSFIEVGWKKLSRQIMSSADTNDSTKDPQIFYWHKIFQNKKDIAFLNFPTPELADHIKTDYEKLLQAYLQGIDCDYSEMKKTGR